IKRVLAYVRQFGLRTGIKNIVKVLTAKAALFTVDVPQAVAPIYLRNGTSDIPTFEHVFVWGDYDWPVPAQPRLIIDGGANIGCAANYFAIRYPEARIIAIEPDASNYQMLERNTAAYTNIARIQAGIWCRSARLKIENPEAEKWEFQVGEAAAGE